MRDGNITKASYIEANHPDQLSIFFEIYENWLWLWLKCEEFLISCVIIKSKDLFESASKIEIYTFSNYISIQRSQNILY